jgi:MATE family multidrug resistance protein
MRSPVQHTGTTTSPLLVSHNNTIPTIFSSHNINNNGGGGENFSLNTNTTHESTIATQYDNTSNDPTYQKKYSLELKAWFKLAWPLAVTLLARTLAMLQDLSVVGHWNSDYLGAAGVATVYTSLTAVVIWRGILEALNTLCGQAFGAGNAPLAGEWLRIGIIVSTLASIVVAFSWIWAGSALKPLANYSEEEAQHVNHFCQVFILGLIPFSLYVAFSNYLSAHGVVKPMLWINLFSLVGNLGFNFLFVMGPIGLGFVGSALATSLTRVCVAAALYIWMQYERKRKPQGLIAESWPKQWFIMPLASHRLEFARQAVPIAISSLLEEAQIQVVGVLAARLGDVEMATHNAVMQVIFVLSSFMWASASATQVRMSLHLGAGDIFKAKLAMRIGWSISTIIGFCVSLAFIVARDDMALLFTKDKEVRHLTGEISILVALGYFALAAFYSSMAVLSAQARPGIVAVAFFTGAWGVGVPCAVLFAFHVEKTKGLIGLWLGLTCGYGVVTIIALVAVWRSDWEDIVRLAEARSTYVPGGIDPDNDPSLIIVVDSENNNRQHHGSSNNNNNSNFREPLLLVGSNMSTSNNS